MRIVYIGSSQICRFRPVDVLAVIIDPQPQRTNPRSGNFGLLRYFGIEAGDFPDSTRCTCAKRSSDTIGWNVPRILRFHDGTDNQPAYAPLFSRSKNVCVESGFHGVCGVRDRRQHLCLHETAGRHQLECLTDQRRLLRIDR